MHFIYKLVAGNGKIKRGVLSGDSKDVVVKNIVAQGEALIYLKEIGTSRLNLPSSFHRGGVPIQELMVMTRQMVAMLGAGLHIIPSLDVIIAQIQNRSLQKVLVSVRQDLLSGFGLAQSLEKHTRVFSPVYINMVKAGESGGMLFKALEQLCLYLEKEQEINHKIKSATLYPAVICLVSLIMVFLIITLVMPSFLSMYQASGLSLPVPTRLLLQISDTLSRYFVWITLLLVILIITVGRVVEKPHNKLRLTRFILHIPLIGKTISGLAVARFARTMGSLVQVGVPVLKGLEIADGIVGNMVVSQALQEACRQISAGASIAAPFKEAGVFTPMVIQMISTGEETGSLDVMLVKLADYYEKEVFHMIDALLALLEPLLIVLVAVMVGAIVIAVLLPILNMVNILQ